MNASVKKNDFYIYMGFALLAVILVIGKNLNRPDYSHVKNISAVSAFQLMDSANTLVLDVRESKAFEKEHLPGAVSVPIGDLDKRLDEFANYKAEKIIVYCNDGSTRGPRATDALNKAGFSDARNLKGGIEAWRQSKFKTAYK